MVRTLLQPIEPERLGKDSRWQFVAQAGQEITTFVL